MALSLTLNDYQVKARETAVYPLQHSKDYVIHGLTNESGEVAGVWKKFYRGDYSYEEAKQKMKKELGDVLWYTAQAAYEFGFTLQEIGYDNLNKLAARKSAGTIQGSGDNR